MVIEYLRRSSSSTVLLLAVGLVAMVIGTATTLRSDDGCVPGNGRLSAYEWRTSAWSTSVAAGEMLATGERLCLHRINVDVTGLAVPELRPELEEALVVLLMLAAESQVEIGAVAGDPWWITPDGLVEARSVITRIIDVNARLEPSARVTALHLDVEPWGLEHWGREAPALAQSYVTFVESIVADGDTHAASGLDLSFLVPSWFDRTADAVPPITVDGVDTNLFDHLTTIGGPAVSWIIMAYRDHALGEGGFIDLIQTEMSASASVGLALETAPVDPLSITFADEGLAALDGEVETAVDELSEQGHALVEIVINDLEHLAMLLPANASPPD